VAAKIDREWDIMDVYNRKLNRLSVEMGLGDGPRKNWAPAQFRRLMYYWLHACKEAENGD
jgi:hypothetical protein